MWIVPSLEGQATTEPEPACAVIARPEDAPEMETGVMRTLSASVVATQAGAPPAPVLADPELLALPPPEAFDPPPPPAPPLSPTPDASPHPRGKKTRKEAAARERVIR